MSSKKSNQQNQNKNDNQVEESSVEDKNTQVEETQEAQEPKMEDTFREKNDFAKNWDDKAINTWVSVMGSDKAFVEDTDVLVFDPYRESRHPEEWETKEIEAFLKGKLKNVKDSRRGALIAELKKRISIDRAWSEQDILQYYRTGEEPKKTKSGVWLRDITRDNRNVSSWTDAELTAWANEEIHTNINSQRLINEINQRFDLTIPTNTTDRQRIKQAIQNDQKRIADNEQAKKKGELTEMNSAHIESVLNRYIEAVKPGREIDTQTATIAQNRLESLFAYVVKLEGRAMVDGLDMIKKAFVEHRNGVFGPSAAQRFTHLVKGDKERHLAMIESFMIVSSPNKHQRKMTDFKAMFRNFPQDQMERLADYFANYA